MTSLYTYVDADGSLHNTMTPGDPGDEGITWVRGEHAADEPEILALLAARALATPTWRTADGRELDIATMTDTHIVHTLRLFGKAGRMAPHRKQQYNAVIEEAKRRNLEVDT